MKSISVESVAYLKRIVLDYYGGQTKFRLNRASATVTVDHSFSSKESLAASMQFLLRGDKKLNNSSFTVKEKDESHVYIQFNQKLHNQPSKKPAKDLGWSQEYRDLYKAVTAVVNNAHEASEREKACMREVEGLINKKCACGAGSDRLPKLRDHLKFAVKVSGISIDGQRINLGNQWVTFDPIIDSGKWFELLLLPDDVE